VVTRWSLRGPSDGVAGDEVVEEYLRRRDVPLHHRAGARVAEPADVILDSSDFNRTPLVLLSLQVVPPGGTGLRRLVGRALDILARYKPGHSSLIAAQGQEGPMAYATSRIGTGRTFPRKHDTEPNSRAGMLGQDRTPVYLLTPAGRR
jgi:hypothetical protein